MDYIEIDGASNNSVDDVRVLIENVNYLPTRGKYKIYVVDEVHMLSVSAFNALLKTLEEPPAHAIFILATTDPQKLLGTVISRTQRYDFKNVPVDLLKDHVLKIAAAEGIKFSSEKIATKLAQLGRGSVRDTLSIFDQVLGLSESMEITDSSLTAALGLAGTDVMKDLVSSIFIGDKIKVSKIFNQLIEENIDLKKLCDQLLDSFFQTINHIDEKEFLVKEDILNLDSLKDVTIAELFWIYETLAKDLQWSLNSLDPEKVVLIQILKVALRRTILRGDDLKVSEVNTSGKQLAGDVEEIKVSPKVEVKKTWDEFLNYLRSVSPATAANLEHGNLLEEIGINSVPFTVLVGFPEEGSVFKDYLDDKDTFSRLKNHLADFFEIDIEKIKLAIQLVSDEEKKDINFRTKAEISEEARVNDIEEKKLKILNNPFIQEAEKLFNSKIDKVILKD